MTEVQQGTKRMASITRRLHLHILGKKMGIYMGYDLLIIILLVFIFIFGQMQAEFGSVQDWRFRSISIMIDSEEIETEREMLLKEEISAKEYHAHTIYLGDWLEHLYLIVEQENTDIVFKSPLYELFILVIGIFVFLFVCQMFGCLLSYHDEDKKIRKIMAPINDMAFRVDELSRLTLSEERYHEIENALDQIQPGENGSFSLENEDLKGIEAAMNNLVLRMRDSYRQQARFVNDASHELRTPITVIQGYVNMLSRWGKEDEKILDESIEAIKNESDHMQHLVEQLLFLARGDSGKTNLDKKDFSLNSMMKEVYEESLMIDEDHIYRFREPEEVIWVCGDLGLLKQATRILIDNAAKYTKKGDEIILSIGRTEDMSPYLQVQDTGIGMAEQDVAHMFERFYRSDEARNYQGTGLGLSIAKWIVDKHHGHFDILSRTELGTRIRIVF